MRNETLKTLILDALFSHYPKAKLTLGNIIAIARGKGMDDGELEVRVNAVLEKLFTDELVSTSNSGNSGEKYYRMTSVAHSCWKVRHKRLSDSETS